MNVIERIMRIPEFRAQLEIVKDEIEEKTKKNWLCFFFAKHFWTLFYKMVLFYLCTKFRIGIERNYGILCLRLIFGLYEADFSFVYFFFFYNRRK